jgi:hypothetical protein
MRLAVTRGFFDPVSRIGINELHASARKRKAPQYFIVFQKNDYIHKGVADTKNFFHKGGDHYSLSDQR